jgi:peptidoglycan/LPS O-acetylase OafA/YrhL
VTVNPSRAASTGGPSPARPNNFDLLRLVLAGSVMLWHLPALSGAPELEPLARVFSADVAVKAFFIISGYLVFMSWERSATRADYASKRARRIYPAYAAIVLVCAAAGLWFGTASSEAYFGAELARYLGANLVFLNFLAPTLPGVFEANPFVEVNGALWTLKVEVLFYACVPLLGGIMVRPARWWILGALYIAAIVWVLATYTLYARTGDGLWLQLQRQLPGQLGYFLVGVALYALRDRPVKGWLPAVAVALVGLVVTRLVGHPIVTVALEPVSLGVLVVFAATVVPHLGNFARFGDLSYGVYIIHFPVIQALVAVGAFAREPIGTAVLAVALVFALAFVSWHAIERPFLRGNSHYRRAAGRDGQG